MTARSKAPDNPAIDEMSQPPPLGVVGALGEDIVPPKPKRPRDPELVAMEQLIKVFDSMPEYCKQRVLSWLQAKYGCGPMGERAPQTLQELAQRYPVDKP